MKTPPRVQEDLVKRIEESRQDRMKIVESYLQGDWLEVGDIRQMYDRLVRKGFRAEAERLLELQKKGIDFTKLKDAKYKPKAIGEKELDEAKSQITEISKTVHEKIIGSSQIMPANFLFTGAEAAKSVCRIITFPHRVANGTGFLVTPNLLLTNNHVLPSLNIASNNIAQFGYLATNDGRPITPVEFRFRPETFFLTSPPEDLDFTLIAVEPVNSNKEKLIQFGWRNLIGEVGKVQQGERLNIIHHPNGLPQQISIRDNLLVKVFETEPYLHYVTDTMPGSSGAPVFNEEWEVVALHHAARKIDDEAETKLYLQGLHQGTMQGITGQEQKEVIVNEGIRISRIVTRLKEELNRLPPEKQKLLNDIFERRKPQMTVQGLQQSLTVGNPSSDQIIPQPEMVNSTASWTIPLQVSVSLGNLSGAIMSTAGSSEMGKRGTLVNPLTVSSQHKTQLELYVDEVNSQRSVFKALSFLEDARDLPYLPSDNEINRRKNEYYGNLINEVNDNQLNEAQLYNSLNELVRNTLTIVDTYPKDVPEFESLHAQMLESNLLLEAGVQYSKARAHLYTWVDLQENRMLRCVYSHKLIAPEQLLLKDLLVQIGHNDLLPQRFRNNQFLNCEHIVPQSWFNKLPIGVSDLHHLITADGAANNFRSDSAFRVLNGNGEEGPENRPVYMPAAGTKQKTNKLFEPANGKPIVARATLYFLLAHSKLIDNSKYGINELETLKDWAKSTAPSNYELHRNEAIFEVQGNRNPLIDFPEWIDLIDFTQGLA